MENKEMKLFDEQLEAVVGGAAFAPEDGAAFCADPAVQQAVTNLQLHVSAGLNNYAGTNKTYAENYSKQMVKNVINDANADLFRRNYYNLKYCMEKGYRADLECAEVLALDTLMNQYGIPMPY